MDLVDDGNKLATNDMFKVKSNLGAFLTFPQAMGLLEGASVIEKGRGS